MKEKNCTEGGRFTSLLDPSLILTEYPNRTRHSIYGIEAYSFFFLPLKVSLNFPGPVATLLLLKFLRVHAFVRFWAFMLETIAETP